MITFFEIIGIVLFVVLSIIVIRISFNFDLNRHLENRRKNSIDQLKNLCPHGRIIENGDDFEVEPYFTSPRGTTDWICSQCNLIVPSKSDVIRLCEAYTTNPKLMIKKHKKFIEKAKKLKLI